MALLTLAQAKAFTNISGSTSDAELQLYVDSVVDVVEGVLGGPVEQRTITEGADVVDGGRALALRKRFATAVTSITSGGTGGTALPVADVYVHRGNVLRRRSGLAFSPTLEPVIVVYTAGIAAVGSVPSALTLAAAVIAGHLWETQRGDLGAAGPGDEYAGGNAAPGLGYAVPNRALELLAPWAPETGLVLA